MSECMHSLRPVSGSGSECLLNDLSGKVVCREMLIGIFARVQVSGCSPTLSQESTGLTHHD
jgi:hypothetical protein